MVITETAGACDTAQEPPNQALNRTPLIAGPRPASRPVRPGTERRIGRDLTALIVAVPFPTDRRSTRSQPGWTQFTGLAPKVAVAVFVWPSGVIQVIFTCWPGS